MYNIFECYRIFKERDILPTNDGWIHQTSYFVNLVRFCDMIMQKMDELREEKRKIADKLNKGNGKWQRK